MALLPPETLGFGDSDARSAYLVQRFLHFIELERFDDRLDLPHCCRFPCTSGWQMPGLMQRSASWTVPCLSVKSKNRAKPPVSFRQQATGCDLLTCAAGVVDEMK